MKKSGSWDATVEFELTGQPGPYERRGVKSLLEIDTCDVCGQDMHPSFLQDWNDKDVCRFCIEDLTREVELD